MKLGIRQFASAGLTILFISVFSVRAQAPSDLDEKAWEAVNAKIVQKIQGIDPNLVQRYAIQLASTPTHVMWDQGDDGAFEFLEVADQMPNWGPTWVKRGSRFSDEYLTFATAIAVRPRNDVDPKELQAKSKAYDSLVAQTNTALRALLKERSAYKAEQRKNNDPIMPYTEWVNNVSKNGAPYKSLVQRRSAAYSAWSNLLTPEDQSIGVFKKKMTEFSFDPDKDVVKGESRYPYNYSTASLVQIKADGDQAWANKTPVFSFVSTSDTEHRKEERESWGGSASYGFFFSVGANHEHYSLDISNQATAFSFAAYGFGFLSIEPRGWFSGVLISKYADKTRPFLPGSPVSYDTLWGPTGSLNLQPVGVVVAYRPQITAHMDKSQINKVRDTLQAGGSVSWGPFSFGGSYVKTTETYDAHAEQGTITISSASPYPYVVAVMSKRLNYVAK